jgi:hypothetical protein
MMPCDISSGPGDVLPARSASVHASRMARSTPRRLSRCDASALLASSSAFTDVLARIHDPGTSALQPHPYLEYRSPAAARAAITCCCMTWLPIESRVGAEAMHGTGGTST